MSEAKRSKFAAGAETFSHICTPIAILFAICQFGCDAHRETEQRRFEIYNEINDQYVQFLETCVKYPWVDCYDTAIEGKVAAPTTPENQRIEGAAFASLISLLERSYVFYQRTLSATDSMVTDQWQGWEDYAKSFACRERFKFHWCRIGTEFDKRFQAWMNGLIAPAGK